MRVVLDTNIVVSGLFFKGIPDHIFELWYQRKFDLLISPDILNEYTRVIGELNRKYPAVQVKPLLDLITLNAHVVEPGKGPIPSCDDPDDEIFLATAMAGKAHYIVTGDKALLRVKTYPGGQVISPKQFISEVF
ncbi:MAG TPA: putative toxin-antitoxin system toxin component, PIN family [Bdellovibrionota bacterium]|nr:putative toxin-antitoxin system toxin component, PIN family [Bdellovibrionota bacterium]